MASNTAAIAYRINCTPFPITSNASTCNQVTLSILDYTDEVVRSNVKVEVRYAKYNVG